MSNNKPSQYNIGGIYTLQDIKFDLLKIIQPYDGYMFNKKDTDRVKSLFISFLSDLRSSYKIREFNIRDTEKENAITFDIEIRIHKDRSPKKLKIHVGKLPAYVPKAA